MPNWCSTNYTIEGPKEELESLKEKILTWTSEKTCPKPEYGNNWLGNIVLGAGLDKEKTEYRGYIECLDDVCENEDTYTLTFQTETAWTAMNDMWYKILAKYAPHCTLYYSSEEPGCEYFVKNDELGKYYPEDYLVDAYIDKPDTPLKEKLKKMFDYTYVTAQELTEDLREITNDNQSSLDTLIQKIKDESEEWDDDSNIHFNEFTIDDEAC